MADADKGASVVNRFYGVYDDGSKLGLTESDLTEQEKTPSTATARVYKNDLEVGYTRSALRTKRGWYITLPGAGERVIDRALVKGELVYFNTIIPDKPRPVMRVAKAGRMSYRCRMVAVPGVLSGTLTRTGHWILGHDAGLSFAGRKTAKGQPGAPKIIGNQLFTPLTDKITGTAPGPRDHFKNTKIAFWELPKFCGRISWQEIQRTN
ncbi:MAG: hypothetical protein CM1200mP41_38080 [Gammaproteobacteria bacterium]|nr:MAG: hypothetical protein CM1200mP41_38080 [Gammaproteobacteria bacterium]